jgi:hypothetical protein
MHSLFGVLGAGKEVVSFFVNDLAAFADDASGGVEEGDSEFASHGDDEDFVREAVGSINACATDEWV